MAAIAMKMPLLKEIFSLASWNNFNKTCNNTIGNAPGYQGHFCKSNSNKFFLGVDLVFLENEIKQILLLPYCAIPIYPDDCYPYKGMS
jgi:hypothetical protein